LTSPDSRFDTRWVWLASIPVAVLVALLSGLLLGWPTLRLRGDYLAIVTLGFAEIIRITADSTPNFLRGDAGFGGLPRPPGTYSDGKPIFGVRDATPYFWLGLSVVIVVILAVRNLDHSRVGRSWLAIREDEEAAEIMGVRTIKFKLWAFAIGAFIGGLGGVMFAGYQGFMNSAQFVLQFSILVLAGVVMGGSGNIAGAILGGALISYIPERLRGVSIAGTDAFEYRYVMFGLAIMLIMIVRPQGLIPSRRRAMELKDRAKEVAPQ
jgi:branched-chain amino acid transport system permease protein